MAFSARARRTSAKCPSCKAPMVGTSPRGRGQERTNWVVAVLVVRVCIVGMTILKNLSLAITDRGSVKSRIRLVPATPTIAIWAI